MGKRPAENPENESDQLKSGERPLVVHNDNEVIDYEDDFEDDFESEDEFSEAGVDGQPSEEHRVEESRGTWITLITLCEAVILFTFFNLD